MRLSLLGCVYLYIYLFCDEYQIICIVIHRFNTATLEMSYALTIGIVCVSDPRLHDAQPRQRPSVTLDRTFLHRFFKLRLSVIQNNQSH